MTSPHRIFTFIPALSLFILAACDDFTRFRHEQYVCAENGYGIGELIINDTDKGSPARLLTSSGELSLEIQDSSKSALSLKGDGFVIHADRQTGLLKIIQKSRYQHLQCEVNLFKM